MPREEWILIKTASIKGRKKEKEKENQGTVSEL